MTIKQHIRKAWLQHPLADGVICGVAFVVITLLLVHFVLPAWAASFPVGGYVIDIGEWAPWVGISVTCIIWWDARQAKRKASEAAATATAAVADIKAVSVQIDGLLVDRDKAKVKEGEHKEKIAGAEKAATLAQGQSEGRDNERERASVAAKSAQPPSTPAAPVGEPPLAVADDRTGDAAERSAKALERTAAAVEDKQK